MDRLQADQAQPGAQSLIAAKAKVALTKLVCYALVRATSPEHACTSAESPSVRIK
ncbi:hypothetical protein [Paraburkholderia youngii]|uniref:hypothetical protein n=1 Tax=Paraburkholderia youngii TaxID=2782701 RepID=UPI003D20E2C1